MSFRRNVLSSGWEFKRTDEEEWMPVATVPTNVHLDLIKLGKIKDPFLGLNELDCEWVGEAHWSYRIKIPAIARHDAGVRAFLALDGLDTYAKVYIDDACILESDNMFVRHHIDVTEHLQASATGSVLRIDFRPALEESRRIQDAHPDHKWVGFNGDMARLAARKAQFHYGWDWGPKLMTCGPWLPVRLETYSARIAHMHIDYEIDFDKDIVYGSITAQVEGSAATWVDFLGHNGDRLVLKASSEVNKLGQARIDFIIRDPDYWWPHGCGEQTMYVITATATTYKMQNVPGERVEELHTATLTTAFRTVELVQEPDVFGRSFYFRVNGNDYFCGGANWIPADMFSPRIPAERYRSLLEAMRDGNQIMVRVWGGGIWEADAFYDICDQLGLLVWQDFMFACGNYPTFPEMLQSIEAEGVCQIKRLRHHPCLAIYAGNNEDYQVQEQLGLTYNYEDKDPASWLKTDFPARYIYEKLLPDIVAAHSHGIPYHPGSPWGNGKATSDPTVGDMHQWNVWHGTQEKYQVFGDIGGRFNSEFGMEAFPHVATIEAFVSDKTQLYPQSRELDFHNKAAGAERRIATYVSENFRARTELHRHVHLTQLAQAEAASYAYRAWRAQWGRYGLRRCGGALIWQLNDVWPGTSWAIIDHFQRRKPAYYTIRRALAKVAIGVQREHHDWTTGHSRPPDTSHYTVWVANSHLRLLAEIELRFVSIATGADLRPPLRVQGVDIAPNAVTLVISDTIDNTADEPHVLAARLWVDGQLLHRDADWPQPLKYLDLSRRAVNVVRDGDRLMVSAGKPTKGLVFEERDGVTLSDSALDVVPGDDQVVRVTGLKLGDPELGWVYLDAP